MLYAFGGGYGDASGYLLVQTFTGHVTGNLVLLALALPDGHWAQIAPRCMAITVFLAATTLGFLMVSWNKARAAALMFVVQAVLLLAMCTPAARQSSHFAIWLILSLCLALGLQNGVFTSVSHVSLHGTYITGNFTTLLSKWVKRSEAKSDSKADAGMTVLLTAIIGFFAGALAARFLAAPLGRFLPASLLLPLLAATLASTFSERE